VAAPSAAPPTARSALAEIIAAIGTGRNDAAVPVGRAPQIIVSTWRRGAETFAVDLAADLVGRGIDAEPLALAAAGCDGDSGCDGAALAVPVLGPGARHPATLRALRRAGRGAGAVVAHGSRTLPACALALAGTGVPFVYRSIGDPRAWSATGWRRRRTAQLLRRARAVVALWPAAADALADLHGVPRDRLAVIPNGVPAARCPVPGPDERATARRRFGLPADGRVVGYLGSLTAEKCVGAAVAAVADLDGVRLLVAGEGPERPALARAAAAAGVADRVTFAGPVVGAAPVLAAVDAVVLPSRTEGMPGALIEAGLAGLPAVATAVGGVGEIVVDGQTGALVPPGDAAALAAGLRRALADGDALGAAARARCLDRFEIARVGASWASLLAGVARPDGDCENDPG
jgi:glycosyltransferase involved in cell wall biosynthesis